VYQHLGQVDTPQRHPRSLEHRKARILQKLPDLSETVRGTLSEEYLTCGHSTCRCHTEGQKHGPYVYLQTTLAPGKNRRVVVPRDLVPRVRGWVQNYRKLKELLETVTEINTEIIRASRGPQAHAAGRRGRRGPR